MSERNEDAEYEAQVRTSMREYKAGHGMTVRPVALAALLRLLDAERARADAAEAKTLEARNLPRSTISDPTTGHVRDYVDAYELNEILNGKA